MTKKTKESYQRVPKEPTYRMQMAMLKAPTVRDKYRAALAASRSCASKADIADMRGPKAPEKSLMRGERP